MVWDSGQVDALQRAREAITLALSGEGTAAVEALLEGTEPSLAIAAVLGIVASFVGAEARSQDMSPETYWTRFATLHAARNDA